MLMTAVELFLDIHASRKTTTTLPAALSHRKEVEPGPVRACPGRGVHHGRAMLTVRPTKPKDFAGKLVLEAPGVNPRVRLFAAADEVAAAGQASLGTKVQAIPATGRRFWVEGTAVSGGLRDSEPAARHRRAGARRRPGGAHRGPVQQPAGDGPRYAAADRAAGQLARRPHHVFAVGPNGFDEDPTVELALPLVENSIVAADPIVLQVTVAPAGVPVRWGAQRASGMPAARAATTPQRSSRCTQRARRRSA